MSRSSRTADPRHVAHLGEVGDGADRPLVAFQDLEHDLRAVRAGWRRASAAAGTR